MSVNNLQWKEVRLLPSPFVLQTEGRHSVVSHVLTHVIKGEIPPQYIFYAPCVK